MILDFHGHKAAQGGLPLPAQAPQRQGSAPSPVPATLQVRTSGSRATGLHPKLWYD